MVLLWSKMVLLWSKMVCHLLLSQVLSANSFICAGKMVLLWSKTQTELGMENEDQAMQIDHQFACNLSFFTEEQAGPIIHTGFPTIFLQKYVRPMSPNPSMLFNKTSSEHKQSENWRSQKSDKASVASFNLRSNLSCDDSIVDTSGKSGRMKNSRSSSALHFCKLFREMKSIVKL